MERPLKSAWLPSLLLSSAVIAGCGHSQAEPAPPKPPLVLVSLPVTKEVTDYEDFTGRTEARESVEVRAQVTGYLKELHFHDGEDVQKDQLLFLIDPRTYQAQLDQTEATLRQAEAHLATMNRNYQRAQELFPRKGISVEDYDKAAGDRDEAQAAVGVARANRDFAQINLDYTRVTAPISGRISRRLVDPGNLVKANDTLLTTIRSLDPIYVYFYIDERTFLRLRRLIQEGKIPSDQDERAPVQVGLADEKGYSLAATVDFQDNTLDPGTGAYRVRAVVPNKDRLLLPGLFVRVRVPIGLPHKAILVSEQALGTDQGQKFVYVVKSKIDPETKEVVIDPETQVPVGQVEYRRVKVGRLQEGLREITDGLALGESVVVRGLQRVRPGFQVTPQVVDMPVTEAPSRAQAAPEAGAPDREKPANAERGHKGN